jgi:hypothetical protein
MKFVIACAALVLTSSTFAHASAAKTCFNSTRGLTLSLPEINSGGLVSSFKITRMIDTLLEVTPAEVSNLVIDSNGLFSFDGRDAAGNAVMSVKTAKDSIGRLIVEVQTKDEGIIGFACPKK